MNICRKIPRVALQCAHTSTTSELLPPGGQHYAKLRCSACGVFLQFLPRPENQQRRIINGYRLAKLQICAGLNPWEQEFVDSLAKICNNKFSPKQQALFDRLCLTHLDGRRAS
jgi:hypothetical protein